MEAAGKKADLYEAYTAGEQDYTALVTKLKDEGIDVVYVGGYHTEAGLIKRQMVEQGMDAVLMSGDALVTDEYWQITGDAGAGTLMTFSPDPRKSPDAAEVVREVPRQRHRAGRLRPLHLRRHPGLGAGGRDGEVDRARRGREGARRGHRSRPCSARSNSTTRATSRCPATSSTSGRTASTPDAVG